MAVFAIGSRAGIFGLLLSLAGSLWVMRHRITFRVPLVAVGVIAAGLTGFLAMGRLSAQGIVDPIRFTLSKTTFLGFLDNLPFGTGFGTFQAVYRRYERVGDIDGFFINHAHNDYFEIMLEGGVPALVFMVVALVLIGLRVLRTRVASFESMAALSIVLVLLHSTIDYPLRTFGLAALFCFLVAVMFSKTEDGVITRVGEPRL